MIGWLLGAAALGLGCYAGLIEPKRLVLRELRVRSVHWPVGYRPLRMAIATDLHTSPPHVTLQRIDGIVARLIATEPDVILLAGDLVTCNSWPFTPSEPEPLAQRLAPLVGCAPTFAVLGNHDWVYGGRRVARAMRSTGITVMVNESVRIGDHQQGWNLVGIDDMHTRHHDPDRALAAIDASLPIVVLTHTPDVFRLLPEGIALTVAGHTHGGQIRIPGWGPLITMSTLPKRMTYGLSCEGERRLLVSGGIGTSKLPIRFGVTPEILLVTLEARKTD